MGMIWGLSRPLSLVRRVSLCLAKDDFIGISLGCSVVSPIVELFLTTIILSCVYIDPTVGRVQGVPDGSSIPGSWFPPSISTGGLVPLGDVCS